MKCIFTGKECSQLPHEHDKCRECRHVPNMVCVNNIETQYRYLCAIAGQRDKCKKYYGKLHGRDPAWFTRILEKQHYTTGIEQCMDHSRSLGKLLVSEPYHLDIDDFRTLIRFCDEHGLAFRVDGNAAWFPGRTFRILIAPIARSKPSAVG